MIVQHLVIVQEHGRTTIFRKCGGSLDRAHKKARKLIRRPGRFIAIVHVYVEEPSHSLDDQLLSFLRRS